MIFRKKTKKFSKKLKVFQIFWQIFLMIFFMIVVRKMALQNSKNYFYLSKIKRKHKSVIAHDLN